MKTTVIYHSADADGLFCREIARKFLPQAELIGWDFGDAPLLIPPEGTTYVMDLPLDAPFGMKFQGSYPDPEWFDRIVWIDHHKSAIESHPENIPGFRIDGVAACRLAWAFMSPTDFRPEIPMWPANLPTKQDFIDRVVGEPLAVRLAGEYDIWDKRDPSAELFQHGLKSRELTPDVWESLLNPKLCDGWVGSLLDAGQCLQFAREREYAEVIRQQGFDLEFETVKFLACNSHEMDIRSQLFAGAIGARHDALLGFTFTGRDWRVSMYHVDGRKNNPDILAIAKKYRGGGHAGACGFRAKLLPFPLHDWRELTNPQ